MPAPCEAPVTHPYGFRWRGLLCITTPSPTSAGVASRVHPEDGSSSVGWRVHTDCFSRLGFVVARSFGAMDLLAVRRYRENREESASCRDAIPLLLE
jgi:hypothetical protein